MAKRKRPEADSVEVSPKVTDREETVPAEEATVGETAATESNPTVGWVAGGVPEDTGVDNPQPVALVNFPLRTNRGPRPYGRYSRGLDTWCGRYRVHGSAGEPAATCERVDN